MRGADYQWRRPKGYINNVPLRAAAAVRRRFKYLPSDCCTLEHTHPLPR